MKLLIITQKIDSNDDILGFFCAWVEEFARHYEKVTVICLEKGEHSFNDNAVPRSENSKEFSATGVKVLSLGKEKLPNCYIAKLLYCWNFYKYIWRERKNYDVVFVHMNPEYIVLGGLFWRLMKKKIALWYVHRKVDLKLKIAEKFADIIFTTSKESFRLPSKKVKFVGHGVNLEGFKARSTKHEARNKFKILSIGRITKIKNCDTIIRAGKLLKDKMGENFKIIFVGSPATQKDENYLRYLEKVVEELKMDKNVTFVGSVPNKDILQYYQEADVTVNATPTGGTDKVVFESMLAGVPAFTSNKAFVDYFGRYSDSLVFGENDVDDLVIKIMKFIESSDEEKQKLFEYLKEKAEKCCNLERLIEKIVGEIK